MRWGERASSARVEGHKAMLQMAAVRHCQLNQERVGSAQSWGDAKFDGAISAQVSYLQIGRPSRDHDDRRRLPSDADADGSDHRSCRAPTETAALASPTRRVPDIGQDLTKRGTVAAQAVGDEAARLGTSARAAVVCETASPQLYSVGVAPRVCPARPHAGPPHATDNAAGRRVGAQLRKREGLPLNFAPKAIRRVTAVQV